MLYFQKVTAHTGTSGRLSQKSERFVEVFLYPDSKKAKQALDGVGADYYVVELDKRKDGSEIQDALAQLTGQRVCYCLVSLRYILS